MDKNELLEQSFTFSTHIVLTCRWMRRRKYLAFCILHSNIREVNQFVKEASY